MEIPKYTAVFAVVYLENAMTLLGRDNTAEVVGTKISHGNSIKVKPN